MTSKTRNTTIKNHNSYNYKFPGRSSHNWQANSLAPNIWGKCNTLSLIIIIAHKNMKWSLPVEGLWKPDFFVIGQARCVDLAQSGNYRRRHQSCSIKKDVFKNFVKFTGEHVCQD